MFRFKISLINPTIALQFHELFYLTISIDFSLEALSCFVISNIVRI